MQDNNHEEDKDHKPVTLIVNGREKQWDSKIITFEQVVTLAYGAYEDNEDIVYTMTYSRGEDGKAGSMVKGDSVKVKKGMIFNVGRANKS